MTTAQQPDSALLYIGKAGPETYKIQSDQLEIIGAKLRGPRHFSIFNSIVLPLIVSVATILFTGLFQFISWSNSIKLENASDVATRAMEVANKVTGAIDRRRYTTLVFIPSLRDLVRAKFKGEKPSEMAKLRETTGSASSSSGMNALPAAKPLVASPSANQPFSLDQFETDLRKARFEGYYQELKRWNEDIDRLLTEVDYALDRPIFSQAADTPQGRHDGVAAYYNKFKNIDCAQSLTDSLKGFGLNPDSLKLRLAAINRCYINLHTTLDQAKTAAAPDGMANAVANIRLDSLFYEDLIEELNHIHTMASEFRCYALYRVDYFNQQKEQSIFGPVWVWKWLTRGQEQDALRHFTETATGCKPENRPT